MCVSSEISLTMDRVPNVSRTYKGVVVEGGRGVRGRGRDRRDRLWQRARESARTITSSWYEIVMMYENHRLYLPRAELQTMIIFKLNLCFHISFYCMPLPLHLFFSLKRPGPARSYRRTRHLPRVLVLRGRQSAESKLKNKTIFIHTFWKFSLLIYPLFNSTCLATLIDSARTGPRGPRIQIYFKSSVCKYLTNYCFAIPVRHRY